MNINFLIEQHRAEDEILQRYLDEIVPIIEKFRGDPKSLNVDDKLKFRLLVRLISRSWNTIKFLREQINKGQ